MILSFVLVVTATLKQQLICFWHVMFLVYFDTLCVIDLVFLRQILLVSRNIFFSLITQQVFQKLGDLSCF